MPIIVSLGGFTPWVELVPGVASHAPECPRPIIEQALRDACREFFSDSHCWRERGLTLITTVAGQEGYTFNPPANAELLEVHACWDSQTEINAEAPGDDDDAYPGKTNGTYKVGVSAEGTQLQLRPAPIDTGTVLKGTVSYTLASNATGIPTWVYKEYRFRLCHGATARLCLQPGKPWSNPQAYGAHRGEFVRAISDASRKAGPVRRKPLRTTPWG